MCNQYTSATQTDRLPCLQFRSPIERPFLISSVIIAGKIVHHPRTKRNATTAVPSQNISSSVDRTHHNQPNQEWIRIPHESPSKLSDLTILLACCKQAISSLANQPDQQSLVEPRVVLEVSALKTLGRPRSRRRCHTLRPRPQPLPPNSSPPTGTYLGVLLVTKPPVVVTPPFSSRGTGFFEDA